MTDSSILSGSSIIGQYGKGSFRVRFARRDSGNVSLCATVILQSLHTMVLAPKDTTAMVGSVIISFEEAESRTKR